MAVKQKDKSQETPVEAAGAENGGNGAEKKERKARTPRDWQWTKERQAALHQVLTAPKAEGTVRTAGSVADALMRRPEFAGVKLTGAEVTSAVKSIAAGREAKNQTVPDYLILDSARRKFDLDLFGE